MRNIFMKVSYDGTAFNGFQSQPKGRTVQQEIEKAIQHLTGEPVNIIGSGRTDAGVHAAGQAFNFVTNSAIPIERWAVAVNSRLPQDIGILYAKEVAPGFHARASAKRKTYRYTIDTNKFPNVFTRNLRFHHPGALDADAMREATRCLIGEHDFTTFTSTRSTKSSHVRIIYDARLEKEEDGAIHLYLTGNGFLYNMVRVIAGTLMWVGEGKMTPDDMARILAACDRKLAGPTAMPHGLMLMDVEYE